MRSTSSMCRLAVCLMLLLPGTVAQAQVNVDARLDEANKAIADGDYAMAEDIYLELQSDTAPETSWYGTSGLVALYRMTGDAAAAREVTAGVAAQRPQLAGLMAIWDGDTALLAGDRATALARYQAALGPALEGGSWVGAGALRQIARLHASGGDAAAAAAAHRELLRRYPTSVWPELEMAQAAVFDAMAAGQLPLKPLSALGHDGDCTEASLCVIDDGAVRFGTEEGLQLAELGGLRFVLSAEDEALLAEAVQARGAAPAAEESPLACAVPQATSGFQNPMVNSASGYVFMSPIGGGSYHPGLDINGPGGCDADLGTIFKTVAKGCVTDSSPSNWGSATIKHSYDYRTSTSQYGHAQAIYYSVDALVAKGANLGAVGKVGTTCAHLHHEMRESDHPNPANADYYSSLTQTNVGDWYQDPFPFQSAHRSYVNTRRADEESFALTGTWYSVTGIGNSDDMKWAYTNSTYTRYARYYFTPFSSGTHEVWAFVPWNYGTSTAARYKVATASGTTVIGPMTINQLVLLDAWKKVGSAYLSSTTQYYVEVATNTGESSKQVALDDVMIHRIY